MKKIKNILVVFCIFAFASCITVYKNSNVTIDKSKTTVTDTLIIKKSIFGK